jgi:hypothetical protein
VLAGFSKQNIETQIQRSKPPGSSSIRSWQKKFLEAGAFVIGEVVLGHGRVKRMFGAKVMLFIVSPYSTRAE